MAIAPNEHYRLAEQIRRVYEEAEISILQKITKNLEGGIDNLDPEDWKAIKLNSIRQNRQAIQAIVNDLNAKMPEQVESIISEAYYRGMQSVDNDLKLGERKMPAGGLPDDVEVFRSSSAIGSMGAIHARAVEALVASSMGALQGSHLQIVRKGDDIYRKVVTQVSSQVLTGVETRRQATQRALNQFAKDGVKGFTDKAGRQWSMSTYAEMSIRANVGQASVTGHINRMKDQGRDLVWVSDHPEECDKCRPWEGRVLSISGKGSYPSVDEAIAGGLFHVGCGHRLNAYLQGITDLPTNTEDPSGYEERMEQRHIERKIREWKRREAIAIDPNAKALANKKVKAWQANMREFIDDKGRKRNRSREQILAGKLSTTDPKPKIDVSKYKFVSDMTDKSNLPKMLEMGREIDSKLSDKDKEVLRRYVMNPESHKINRFIYSEEYRKTNMNSDLSSIANDLSSIINRHTISENMRVVRNVDGDFLGSMLKDLGVNISIDADKIKDGNFVNTLNSSLSGVTYRNKGFLSTSFDPTLNMFAVDKPISMEILVDKGKKGFLTTNLAESEIIFDKNSELEILNLEVTKNHFGKEILKMVLKLN